MSRSLGETPPRTWKAAFLCATASTTVVVRRYTQCLLEVFARLPEGHVGPPFDPPEILAGLGCQLKTACVLPCLVAEAYSVSTTTRYDLSLAHVLPRHPERSFSVTTRSDHKGLSHHVLGRSSNARVMTAGSCYILQYHPLVKRSLRRRTPTYPRPGVVQRYGAGGKDERPRG